jgi:molecular chaperone GrpE
MSDDDVILEPEDGEGATKSLNQKLKEIREQLRKTEKERAEYLDGWQRTKADYVNAKKRAEEARQEDLRYASASLIGDILPALDSLDQALEHLEEDSELTRGLSNTRNQLTSVLQKHGLESFDPTGETFDPNIHEPMDALAVSDESEDNIVTKVYQKGYALHGKVIRPARVQVGHFNRE